MGACLQNHPHGKKNGIKPVVAFDGKPPTMKGRELEKRKEKRDEAQAALEKPRRMGTWRKLTSKQEAVYKVLQQSTFTFNDVKILLSMGVPP